jgi:hypothetical protein
MYRTLAVAAVLVTLSVGSVAYGADRYDSADHRDVFFFDGTTINEGDQNADTLVRATGHRWTEVVYYDSSGSGDHYRNSVFAPGGWGYTSPDKTVEPDDFLWLLEDLWLDIDR